MNKRTVGYWVATGIFCAAMTGGGVADLLQVENMKEAMASLGYPLYLLKILGVAKLLGVLALLLPRTPILKEWAYAGFTFDLLGAAASHGLNGDAIAELVPPIVILTIGAASYLLRPDPKRIASPN